MSDPPLRVCFDGMLTVIICTLVFLSVIGLDQIAKALTDGMEAAEIIRDILYFKSVHNTGAAFSMLGGVEWAKTFFIVLTVVAVALGTVYLFVNRKSSLWLDLSIVLIIGGAIGNFIDRVVLGYVRDFIFVTFFANFNVADAAITVGAVMLVLFFLFIDKDAVFRFGKKDEKN